MPEIPYLLCMTYRAGSTQDPPNKAKTKPLQAPQWKAWMSSPTRFMELENTLSVLISNPTKFKVIHE